MILIRSFDGIFIKNAVLVVQAKSEKSLKVKGVGAGFGVWWWL